MKMNYKKTIFFLLIITQLLFTHTLFAQEIKKNLKVTRTETAPKIDGVLNDASWINAPVAKDFIQFQPYNGKQATETTVAKIIYDDDAIYFGIMMYDNKPDSIYTVLTKRDAGFDGDADIIAVSLSTFNDGINSNIFIVSAAGVQSDIKGSANNMDENWDVVWQSAVNITDSGWVAEIAIPYSALRFSKEHIQTWGINIFRILQRKNEGSSWNWVNNEIQGFSNQQGEITGIEGVKPPLRLSFTPYFSAFAKHNSEDGSWERGVRGGMDLKYGINESFTLDMMLIPDFSQVQSDDVILNLSAFETQYEERRPFFTEGTELFAKGDIFYSKRIGSTPQNIWDVYDDLGDNEEITENPSETQIINATKVTGRTKKGLGIGFFNAMTLKSEAVIRDTLSGIERNYTTQPFTNYNIFVFDQNLKNNSYASIINTNMTIPNSSYTANVTAAEFLVKNKNQNYAFGGSAGLSQTYEEQIDTDFGFKYNFEMAKTGGKFRFGVSQDVVDDKFDSNDMGFLLYNNYMSTGADVSYQILQPYKNLLQWQVRFDSEYENQFNTGNFVLWQIGMNMHTTFKSQWDFGFFFDMTPLGEDDYYESRQDNQVYKMSPGTVGGTFFGSDRRKKVSFRAFAMYWTSSSVYNENTIRARVSPTWRVNDKLRFTVTVAPSIRKNDIGYVDELPDTIVFGRRDRKTLTNTFTTDFTFNAKMSLSLRARHYWSSATYKQFYDLNKDGTLSENDSYDENNNINFNAFNVDMVYTWRFAPGSDLLLVWKNSVYDFDDEVVEDYMDNLTNTFKAPQTNMFSIKVLYYLDYLYLKKKKH